MNENALLSFAIESGHTQILNELLRRSSSQNNQTLTSFATNTESSMIGLSRDEERRLDRIKAHYHPALQLATLPQVMDDLRVMLVAKYEANPARVTCFGRSIALPMYFDDFILHRQSFFQTSYGVYDFQDQVYSDCSHYF